MAAFAPSAEVRKQDLSDIAPSRSTFCGTNIYFSALRFSRGQSTAPPDVVAVAHRLAHDGFSLAF